jgi:phosphoglycolate phosphatase
MKKLIVFDMDDTLIQSKKVHYKAYQKAFEKNHLKKYSDRIVKKEMKYKGSVVIKKLYPELHKSQVKKVIEDYFQFVREETHKYAKPYPHVLHMLPHLARHFKLAIVTNCRNYNILPILDAAGIHPIVFDEIIGRDDVKEKKPSPEGINLVKKRLNIKKGYMVGDSIKDITAARKAGLTPIGVLTGFHTKQELEKEKPKKIIKSIKEIYSAIHPE